MAPFLGPNEDLVIIEYVYDSLNSASFVAILLIIYGPWMHGKSLYYLSAQCLKSGMKSISVTNMLNYTFEGFATKMRKSLVVMAVLMMCSCCCNLRVTPDDDKLGLRRPWPLPFTLCKTDEVDEKTSNEVELQITSLDKSSCVIFQVSLNGLCKSELDELLRPSLVAPRLSPSTPFESGQPGVGISLISVLCNCKSVIVGMALAAPQLKGVLQNKRT